MAEVLVSWGSKYCLGLEEIDAQHKSLVDIINNTWQAIIDRADRDTTQHLLGQLEMYTLAHFAAEETFMRVTNFPQFDAHKYEHQQFVARIVCEKNNFLADGKLTLDLMYFLKDWLIDHILCSDKAYVEFTNNGKANQVSTLGRFFKRFWS